MRKTLQGGAGIKLYLTPSEPDTIAELSEAVGMTTKRVVSKSKNIKDGLFSNNLSERTEEHPLLTRDQARRLPREDVVIVVDGDMPIRAKRLVYHDDTTYKPLYESQDFTAPLPQPPHAITEADYRYIETTEDTAEKKDEAEKKRDDAKAKATEKRDAEAANSGQGQFDFGGNEPSAQAAPSADSSVPQKAAETTSEGSGEQGASDLSQDHAAATPAPATQKPVPLSDENDLILMAAKRRKEKQEQQSSLPLPEVSQGAGAVSMENAGMANLAIAKLVTTISQTLAAGA